ncbi:hypothetical protein [Actinomadura spongiicola]|uniref:hypothetical protein n=1 Tax=Actinomadura spongiicola TaxID=2303421 RepID=UPI0011C1C1A1|nr:hypothetical protein [Actinomadura spongiicola]
MAAWILGLFAFLASGLGVGPVLVGVTAAVGEPAKAVVEHCANTDRSRSLQADCEGTWVTADGARSSGHISGVGSRDIDEEVPVRVGPFGPYKMPVSAYWQVYAPLPAVGWIGYLLARRRLRKPRPAG